MVQTLNRKTAQIEQHYPERVVQFGAGNFLRAFVDWMIQRLNQETDFAAGVVAVKASPRQSSPNSYERLNVQDGLYHLVLTDSQDGAPITEVEQISAITRALNPYQDYGSFLALARQPEIRFIFSNTTEAGIRVGEERWGGPAEESTFPANLTRFLYERFSTFEGEPGKGCILLPCELIEDNGIALKETVLTYADRWGLGSTFTEWINRHNYFCNTLVDRIVTGYPHGRAAEIEREIGFEDPLLVEGERYHSFIIEAPEAIAAEFPADTIGLNVKFVPDATPYREMKVRILNGAHTALVPVGLLSGLQTVDESIADETIGPFLMQLLFEEILPTLDYPSAEKEALARSVIQRFRNPFLAHQLLDISLNSTSKFVTRLLPTLKRYIELYGRPPERVSLAFAALMLMYREEWHSGEPRLKERPEVLAKWREIWESERPQAEKVKLILQQVLFWEEDLTALPDLLPTMIKQVDRLTTATRSDNIRLRLA